MERLIRVIPLILILTITSCRQKENPVLRTLEDGVEIVLNDPGFDSSPPPRILELWQELVIDLSSFDLVQRGLSDPAAFDVDAAGNLLVWSQSSNDAHFFKFSPAGVLLAAFGRSGQGPGEVRFLTSAYFEASGEIMAWDSAQSKMVFFDEDGVVLRQNTLSRRPSLIVPLGDGRYVTLEQEPDPVERLTIVRTLICGPDLEIVKEIGRKKVTWPGPGRRFPALQSPILLAVSRNYVFFGNSEAGYEIACYEKSGLLKRIVRKVYQPVPLSAEDRSGLIKTYERFPPEFRANVEYPDKFPPYQRGFADDEDRLFVMTYEESGEKGHYWHDVFGRDGEFAGRVSLGNYGTYARSQGILFALARRGRIYHFREKADGFKEIVVWRMK
jgi:hypothetical protein